MAGLRERVARQGVPLRRKRQSNPRARLPGRRLRQPGPPDLVRHRPVRLTANGERWHRTEGADVTTYSYDAVGNLRQVVLPATDGRTVTYYVDPAGRRVGRTITGGAFKGWLYDTGLSPVAEVDNTGAVTAYFIYGNAGHVPEFMVKSGVTYRIFTDHLGSPRLVTNAATGAILQQCTYDEFGSVADSNPGFQPFGFAGGLYDPDTGLVHFGAREYDPEVGRWLSKDPILFEGGQANLYVYVNNDPVNSIDPEGTGAVAGCVVAALADLLWQKAIEGKRWGCVSWSEAGGACLLGALGGQFGKWFKQGKEFTRNPKEFRFAPFGNRTGHPTGRWPHYHRKVKLPSGGTKPGQSLKRHRPWDKKSTDTSFWDRF